MIRAKLMIRNWFGRLLAGFAAITVTVATMSESVSAADFPAADDLMARLMATDNVSGVAIALIKDGTIVLEKGYGFRDLETMLLSPRQPCLTVLDKRPHSGVTGWSRRPTGPTVSP